MSSSSPTELPLTQLLRRALGGEVAAADQALPFVYPRLRRIAAATMLGERRGHTWQPTALVHEAWLEILRRPQIPWNDRASFFRAIAETMRRLLIDHARRRMRQKRGGDLVQSRVELDTIPAHATSDIDAALLLQLDEAIEELSKKDSRAATIVRLRFFASLQFDEIAEVLRLSERTAQRDWTWARAWLFARLAEQERDRGNGDDG